MRARYVKSRILARLKAADYGLVSQADLLDAAYRTHYAGDGDPRNTLRVLLHQLRKEGVGWKRETAYRLLPRRLPAERG